MMPLQKKNVVLTEWTCSQGKQKQSELSYYFFNALGR